MDRQIDRRTDRGGSRDVSPGAIVRLGVLLIKICCSLISKLNAFVY